MWIVVLSCVIPWKDPNVLWKNISQQLGNRDGQVLLLGDYDVAIWSALLLAIGNFCYASTGGSLGYAISYSLSRGTLLVSALWGILCYKEFNGADCKTWTTQLGALYLFVAAIVVVAMA